MITTVITNCGRSAMLLQAFRSVRAARIENIVIASAPTTDEVRQAHALIRREHPATKILAFKDDPGCNATWLTGVKAATTEWVHILHDDDLILPKFRERIEATIRRKPAFILFDASAHNADGTIKAHHHKLWYRSGGSYPTDALRVALAKQPYSLSPVSGLFRREHLVSVLEEFEKNCANRREFQLSAKMHIGNDLLIWLRATELAGNFVYLNEPLVSYGNHNGSATCIDRKSKQPKLPAMYQATKKYWSASLRKLQVQSNQKVNLPLDSGKNVATFCYLPDIKAAQPFLAHLDKFTRTFPLHILVHGDVSIPGHEEVDDVISIPTLGPFKKRGINLPSDQYAMMAFLHMLRIAKEKNLEWFILIENDCRFSKDNWDRTMWMEFNNSFVNKNGPQPLFGGSPVCWHPWSKGHTESQHIIQYAYRYQKASGIAMAFEGEHDGKWGMAIYPNGALAIYNVAECLEYFAEPMKYLDASATMQSDMCGPLHTFDLHLGRSFVKKHGVKGALDRLAFLPSTYSGCKNHHVSVEQRIEMLKTTKVAIHHLKPEECPFT